MELEALYDNGHLILLQQDKLPAGTMRVTVNFPDENLEISAEWKAELERRAAAIDSGEEALIPAEEVFTELEASQE